MNEMKILTCRAGKMAYLLLCSVSLLPAQVATGSIAGLVADESHAVVPSVTITLINRDTGVQKSGKTDAAGDRVSPLERDVDRREFFAALERHDQVWRRRSRVRGPDVPGAKERWFGTNEVASRDEHRERVSSVGIGERGGCPRLTIRRGGGDHRSGDWRMNQ